MFGEKKSNLLPNLAISNVRQRDVADLDIVVPLVEQLDVADLLDNILGEGVGNDGVLDLDFTTVRHLGYLQSKIPVLGGTAVSIADCRDVIFQEVKGGLGRRGREILVVCASGESDGAKS